VLLGREAAVADVIGRPGRSSLPPDIYPVNGSRFLVIAREATQSRHHRLQRHEIASPLSGSQ